jgi:hypothetical protein
MLAMPSQEGGIGPFARAIWKLGSAVFTQNLPNSGDVIDVVRQQNLRIIGDR